MMPLEDGPAIEAEEFEGMAYSGWVRATTGVLGTEIKWHVASPCYAALCTAMEWLKTAAAPVVLRFLAVGWFEEIHTSADSAIRRIEDIMARGDRHFPSRIFTKQLDPQRAGMPELLQQAMAEQQPARDYAVVCSFDERSQHFVVDEVGAKSAIGRVWGTYTSSPPCQPLGSYGDTVAEAYAQVLRKGTPRYDHVLAALRLPDNSVHWVPYHRLILPRTGNGKRAGVSIVSQIAAVDIRVL